MTPDEKLAWEAGEVQPEEKEGEELLEQPVESD